MAQANHDGASPGSEEDKTGNDEGLIMNFDGIIKVYHRYPLPVEEPWVPRWIETAPTEHRITRKVLISHEDAETGGKSPEELADKCNSLSALIDKLREEAHEYFTENQQYIDYLLNKDTPIGVTVVTPLGRIEYDLEQWEVIIQMIQATRFKTAEHHADLEQEIDEERTLHDMTKHELHFLQKELDKHRSKEEHHTILSNIYADED